MANRIITPMRVAGLLGLVLTLLYMNCGRSDMIRLPEANDELSQSPYNDQLPNIPPELSPNPTQPGSGGGSGSYSKLVKTLYGGAPSANTNVFRENGCPGSNVSSLRLFENNGVRGIEFTCLNGQTFFLGTREGNSPTLALNIPSRHWMTGVILRMSKSLGSDVIRSLGSIYEAEGNEDIYRQRSQARDQIYVQISGDQDSYRYLQCPLNYRMIGIRGNFTVTETNSLARLVGMNVICEPIPGASQNDSGYLFTVWAGGRGGSYDIKGEASAYPSRFFIWYGPSYDGYAGYEWVYPSGNVISRNATGNPSAFYTDLGGKTLAGARVKVTMFNSSPVIGSLGVTATDAGNAVIYWAPTETRMGAAPPSSVNSETDVECPEGYGAFLMEANIGSRIDGIRFVCKLK